VLRGSAFLHGIVLDIGDRVFNLLVAVEIHFPLPTSPHVRRTLSILRVLRQRVQIVFDQFAGGGALAQVGYLLHLVTMTGDDEMGVFRQNGQRPNAIAALFRMRSKARGDRQRLATAERYGRIF
jgi:hypothetical protein